MSDTRSAVAVVVVLSAFAASCGGCGGDDTGQSPQDQASRVALIEVLPPVVQATPGSRVYLQARLITEEDHLVPWTHVPGGMVPPEIWWDVPADVEIAGSPSTGPFIALKMPPETPPGFDSRSFAIRAQVADPNLAAPGLGPAWATIEVIGSATAPGATYDSVAGVEIGFPQVARVRGPSPLGDPHEWWLAFVGGGRFPDFGAVTTNASMNVTATGGTVDFLSVAERHRSLPAGWTPGPEHVDRPVLFPDLPTRVSVRVWKAVTSLETSGTPVNVTLEDVRDLVVTQLKYADIIFRMNRAGVRLDTLAVVEYGDDLELEVDLATSPAPLLRPDPALPPVDACSHLWSHASSSAIQAFGGGSVSAPRLEIFIIRDLGFGRGYACMSDPVLLIEYRDDVANGVLAHELGHLLGLRDDNSTTVAQVGHTDDLPGFEIWNLMRSSFSDAVASERAHLSVGQAYRMNRHTSSVIHMFRPDPPVDCGMSSDGNVECPPLAFDLNDVGAASP